MRLAIQASDLDHRRIDGTRVYLREILNRFGPLSPETLFLLYHRHAFNPLIAPAHFPNYREVRFSFPYAWMQTAFARALFREKPEKLFLPIQAAPLFIPRGMEVTATIHDLAFKRFPETFPKALLFKLNVLLGVAVRRADKLIAVSQATKEDILRYFPELPEEKIRVIHHGFAADFYERSLSSETIRAVTAGHRIEPGTYVLYVGALQPRKNLVRLIQAFDQTKAAVPDMKLVLVGERAWLSEAIFEGVRRSAHVRDIHLVGQANFEDLRAWYQGARLFAYPSLCEGFGIPVLEAFASGTPVLTANNSSLPEVAGNAALYADAESVESIASRLAELWKNEELRRDLVTKGKERLKKFSWDKCAQETLDYLLA